MRVSGWQWEHFAPKEVLSPTGLKQLFDHNELMLQVSALNKLALFRAAADAPILCNFGSCKYRGYRAPSENTFGAGGAPLSRHVQGIAFDVTIEGYTVGEMFALAKAFGWAGIGAYYDMNFIHVDDRHKFDGLKTIWSDRQNGT